MQHFISKVWKILRDRGRIASQVHLIFRERQQAHFFVNGPYHLHFVECYERVFVLSAGFASVNPTFR